ncbi:uncharacterized protein LOC107365347 [Tetranychus urticae]|uniref:ZP domain-containing protein n=1 Tax=Tetranychus urticae TaxID=32264 RepID=T1KL79_TETUR|nr:uncharacterized protein LOC107365347 [Tetranychus urticae]
MDQLYKLISLLWLITITSASRHGFQTTQSGDFKVQIKCSETLMEVTVGITKENPNVVIYLEKLKGYPGCQPELLNDKAVFRLPLDDNFYTCGTTRIQNKLKDVRIFYNRVIIERPDKSAEVVVPKCVLRSDLAYRLPRSRRQTGNDWELPENFTESVEELIDYSGNITEHAPIPYLNIGVRQNGRFVDTALNVHPGTPLEMVIYLDDTSAPVYGLLARYLKVTDNTPRKQEETIILEGCSIDPYIFSNFESNDGGDSIVAKFRAFKFPESNYVLFVGTVNVCLKECLGVICGNNQLGYGRRRRSIINPDPNRIFEIEMTAFLKVDSLEMDNGPVLKGSARSSLGDDKSLSRQDEPKHEAISKEKQESRSLPLLDAFKTDRRRSFNKLESSSATSLTISLTILILTSTINCFIATLQH